MATHLSESMRAKVAAAWPEILASVADGQRYREILARVGVSYACMCAWRAEDPERRRAWEDARKDSASAFIDRIVDLTNDSSAGLLDPARARVQLDSLKFIIEKLDPERYGQRTRVDVQHSVDIRPALERAARRAARLRRIAVAEPARAARVHHARSEQRDCTPAGARLLLA